MKRFLTIRGGSGSLKASAVATSIWRNEVLDRNEIKYKTAKKE
jgi:hypothetical protein